MRRRSTVMGLLRHASMIAALVSLGTTSMAPAQIRFHSASEEQVTADIVAALDKARTAHLAALDAHRAYLVEALARERTLLVKRELAERDAFLTFALGKKTGDAVKALGDQIDIEWAELTGGLPKSNVYGDFVIAAHRLDSLEIERAGLVRNRNAAVALFESRGGKGTYCDDHGGVVQFTQLADSAEATVVSDTCDELATNARQILGAYKSAGVASSLLGNPNGNAGGMIGDAAVEGREIAALIAAQTALTKVVKKQVKDLDAYYQCQLGRVSTADAIRADAAAVQKALDTLASGDADDVFKIETFKKVWGTLAGQDIDPDCTRAATPAAAPAPTTGKSAISAEDIVSAVKALDKYAADDALLALLRDTALDVQGSALGEALKGLAAAPGDKLDSKTAQRAQAALMIFGALDTLYRANNGTLPDTAGVLVALTDVRMRQATAKIEAGRLAELERLNGLRLVALRQRAILLADARAKLAGGTDAALIGALRRYADSVNQGAIPATILSNDMVKGRYLPWLDRERAVVDAGYGVLIPAASQLQSYGEGGITADTVAQFLQAVGLGGIAVK